MRKPFQLATLSLTLFLFAISITSAQTMPTTMPATVPSDWPETPEHKDARMQWFREAKFGMFVHWGLFSVPAGTYNGKKVHGLGEWIMSNGKIPVDVYAKYPGQLTGDKFDADQWMQIAEDAGAKYVVVTTKHHEGFAMFPTAVDRFNIVDASPFHRDPLAELAAAAKKHGIKLGFYYSQAQDWHHPGGAAMRGRWDRAQYGSMDEYIDHVAIPQVREILSNYGDAPALLWWDTPTGMTRPMADKLYKVVKELRPNIIMNDRLGGGYKGDSETPEQRIPAKGYPGRDWESCMTINDTWGYKSYDTHFKSNDLLVFNLVDIVSKGGNYLLNVGPTAEGEIPAPEVDRLRAVGAWLKINGEAIYGCGPSCFGVEYGETVNGKDGYGGAQKVSSGKDWRCTTKPGKIFIHIFKWPGGTMKAPALKAKITKGYMLADPSNVLAVSQNGGGVTATLPAKQTDPIDSVLVLETSE